MEQSKPIRIGAQGRSDGPARRRRGSEVSIGGLTRVQRWLASIEMERAAQRGLKVPRDLAALAKGEGQGAQRLVNAARDMLQR